jgi:diguanylate cyclase (GGDEF)-like protein
VEYFQERAVLDTPTGLQPDFLAVFFGFENATPDTVSILARVFPGAEIIGFRGNGRQTELLKRKDGLLVVSIPMRLSLAQHVLDTTAQLRESRMEISQARRRLREIEEFSDALVTVVESAWSVGDRKLGINLLINKFLGHLNAEECVIYLAGEDGGPPQRCYSTGNIKDLDVFDFQANHEIVERVISTGNPFVDNEYSFELKVPFSKDGVNIRSVLCYPLLRGAERIGAVELLNKRDRTGFSAEDQEFLERIAAPVAVGVRNISMFEQSERLTVTDDLTKLYNYRYLMQYLEAEVKRCLRYKKKVSLLFIDVDGFKRINDTFGHLVGSQALAEMGQVLRHSLRETDVVSRYGGDEFVVVLPETPLPGALVIAERIRKKVEEFEFAANNLNIRLTVSLGVANCPKHTLTAEGLIKKADAAMYRAKEISKNSIKVAV